MTVTVPGSRTDQQWVRLASRRMYGELLESGMRIFEYERGMTHVKALVVDDLWSVIGTTNLDNRSFEHNDEVNVAIRDAGFTARVSRNLEHDRAASLEVTRDHLFFSRFSEVRTDSKVLTMLTTRAPQNAAQKPRT